MEEKFYQEELRVGRRDSPTAPPRPLTQIELIDGTSRQLRRYHCNQIARRLERELEDRLALEGMRAELVIGLRSEGRTNDELARMGFDPGTVTTSSPWSSAPSPATYKPLQ